ncbi:MAG: hypothetical protein QOG16_997, partial [Actinomycetota bacterium]|nr:hypothetical protein [Actinomycetota bacterium]
MIVEYQKLNDEYFETSQYDEFCA